MIEIYPSLLAADQDNLEKAVRKLEALCPGFHIDIMDNKFVPNKGISVEKANTLAKLTYRQLWVHLMVEDPDSYIEQLQLPVDSIITFHIESHKKTIETINNILKKKWLPGIAIKPETGPDSVFPFLDSLYQVLIMSVEPGFSGQPFLQDTVTKIDTLVGYRQTSRLNFKIAMDGGIDAKNIQHVAQKGIDQFAIGSGLFQAPAGAVKAFELLSKLAE